MCVSRPSRLSFVACWIILCAFLNCAGWILSAVHELNRIGYGVLFALGAAGFLFWQRKQGVSFFPQVHFRKQRRRFRRWFPLAFLILATLAILGGVIHAPSNYDALGYRIPRVLHWLSEERWHWIHTMYGALNVRVCGIEWVSAPLIAFSKSCRLVFLPNVVSFLLLPGLVFSVFTRLGVRQRVAWHWMWLLPTGYCFLLQAGSVANDMFGAPFALAAVDFGLRAKDSRRFRDVALAMISAALLTSAKPSNLPLLLPCVIALLPLWKLILRRLIALCTVLFVAALCSFLPTAVLNVKYCGDWTGLAAEPIFPGFLQGYALERLACNSVVIVVLNLAPPVFPAANAWNQAMHKLIPSTLAARLDRLYNRKEGVSFRELEAEECAGLGFGVTLLVLVAMGARFSCRARPTESAPWTGERALRMALTVSPYVGLAVFLAKASWTSPVRYLAPYYPLLLPLLLAGPEQEKLVRKAWWRIGAGIVFVLAALLVIISPARPLWPAEWLLTKAGAKSSTNPLLVRAARVYSIHSRRGDAFAPIRNLLPAEANVLGMITCNDPEPSLWMPWGARRIVHVCPADTAEDLRRKGIKYVLVKSVCWGWPLKMPSPEWLAQHDGEVVQTIPLDLLVPGSPVDWFLVKLR